MTDSAVNGDGKIQQYRIGRKRKRIHCLDIFFFTVLIGLGNLHLGKNIIDVSRDIYAGERHRMTVFNSENGTFLIKIIQIHLVLRYYGHCYCCYYYGYYCVDKKTAERDA